MVGDGERIAVLAVAELELALEIGTPQLVGCGTRRQRGSGSAITCPADAFDQAMAIEHGMDSALGGHADIAGQAADQELADLARAPVRLLPFEPHDEAFDLLR